MFSLRNSIVVQTSGLKSQVAFIPGSCSTCNRTGGFACCINLCCIFLRCGEKYFKVLLYTANPSSHAEWECIDQIATIHMNITDHFGYIEGADSPSVLILRAVRTRANRVALNMTVPSLFRGMFIATRRCNHMQKSVCQSCTKGLMYFCHNSCIFPLCTCV